MPQRESNGGSRIYHHEQTSPSTDEVAHADVGLITAHLEKHLGAGGSVWHELVSDRIHLDIHVSTPTETRPYSVLTTSGMSALPMSLPDNVPESEKWTHGELCIILPPTWPLSQAAFRDDNVYWPIRLLKQLGRLPHAYNTWLSWGHSIPNGDPPEPYAKGPTLCGAIILPPYVLGTEFFELDRPQDQGGLIHFFQVIPVHAAEMAFKLEHGIDALVQELAKCSGALDAIDAQRPSAV